MEQDLDLIALTHALEESIAKKNTLTTVQFKHFHPLFKKATDTTTEQYATLCEEWTQRVSLYDPVTIIEPSTNDTVVKLPAMFNKVNDITTTGNPDVVINKFRRANAEAHPLRHDKEDALFLFKATLDVAQDRKRLDKEAEMFSTLSKQAGFEGSATNAGTIDEETLGKLEWE